MEAYSDTVVVVSINVYDHSFFIRSGDFFVSASVWDARNWNFSVKSLRSIVVFGGGSNAPRPALSVRHLDVDADGC